MKTIKQALGIVAATLALCGTVAGGILFLSAQHAGAAPTVTYQPTILPQADSTYNLGSAVQAWSHGYFDTLCLTGDSCITTWPSGGGSSTGLASSTAGSGWTAGYAAIVGDDGHVYGQSTSTPSIGSVLTYSGTLGKLLGGTDGTFGIANTSITNAMLAGSIANSKLANSSVTVNGTSISLGGSANVLTANTCSAGDFISAVTAAGVFTCSTPTGGGGGTGNVATSTTETPGYLAYWTSNGATPALLGKVATSTLGAGTGLSVSGSGSVVGSSLTVSAASGYNVPLTASTTNWNTFYDTPSNRITAGTDLSWSGNTLNFTGTIPTKTSDLTNDSGFLSSVDLTTNVTGILPIANGGTATSTGGVTNSFSFYDGSTITNNGNFLLNSGHTTAGFGLAASNSRRLSLLTDSTVTQGLTISGDSTSRTAFSSFVTGDAQLRFSFLLNGTQKWSDGSASPDIQLSRTAAGELGVQGLNSTNSTHGFNVLTAAGGYVLDVDTTNSRVGVATSSPYKTFAVGGDAVIGASTAGGTLGNLYIPARAVAAGQFAAFDPQGQLIGTSTPAVTPGGSDTQVQFNDGGTLAGAVGFVWDKVNRFLGIGTTTPSAILSVQATTTDKILAEFDTATSSNTYTTNTTTYTSGATWTKPAGLDHITVKVVGGGGGGAGWGCNGTGGAGGAGASSSFTYNSGGNTILANGGSGGNPGTGCGSGSGGSAGSASGGDTNLSGSNGTVATGGASGNSEGASASTNVGGHAYGGGGGGGGSSGGGGGAGYAFSTLTASQLGATETITVGGGGGGGAGSSSSGHTSGSGGDATGSTGGTAGTGSQNGTPSAGADAGSSAGNSSGYSGAGGAGGEVVITEYILSTPTQSTATTTAFKITNITALNGTLLATTTPAVGIGTSTPWATFSVQSFWGVPARVLAAFIGAVNYTFEEIDKWGHILTNGPAPTANSCTGFAVMGSANDRNGTINMTSGTTCSITWANAYSSSQTVQCAVIPGSAASTVLASTTSSGLSITFGTAQTRFSYICQASQ